MLVFSRVRAVVRGFLTPQPRLVRQALSTLAAGPDRRVFVRSLAWKADEQAVRAELGKFGKVNDVHLPASQDGRSAHRGFGFVSFESISAARAAMIQTRKSVSVSTIK